MENKINQPQIFNVDIFEKALDKLYMDLIYIEAKIENDKKKILDMQEFLEFEKDLWHYNG